MTDARKLARIDRGNAVNLARNIMDQNGGPVNVTVIGIRNLAEAVMRMDEALRPVTSAAFALLRREL